MPRRLLILGAGGHGRAVADLAAACDWTVAGFTDRPGADPRVLGGDEDLPALARSAPIDAGVIGVGNSALQRRAELFDRLRESRLPIPALVSRVPFLCGLEARGTHRLEAWKPVLRRTRSKNQPSLAARERCRLRYSPGMP